MTCPNKLAACLVTALVWPGMTVSGQARQQESRQLRWTFEPGDQLEIRIDQQTSSRTTVDRRQVDQSSRMQVTVAWDVESVDDSGAARIRQTITAIRAEVTLPDARGPVTTVYDSSEEKPRGDARRMAESFSRILNQPVTITMTPRGTITEVDVPEETLESIRQMPGSVEGRQTFSVDSLREMFQSAGTEFPQAPVVPGQSWVVQRDFQIGSPHRFARETTYTLDESGNIDFQSTLAAAPDPAVAGNPDAEFRPWTITRQEASGRITLDAGTGQVTGSDSTMSLDIGTDYQGMSVGTTLESRIEMSVTRQ